MPNYKAMYFQVLGLKLTFTGPAWFRWGMIILCMILYLMLLASPFIVALHFIIKYW